jgi:phosphatidyl-myo-inositol dimannoside synthase
MPACGGTITWLVETYSRYRPGEVVVVAGEQSDAGFADEGLPFEVERICMSMDDWDPTQPTSLWAYLRMFRRIRKVLRRHGPCQIHCMKVLPEGLIAWCLRHFSRIPYLVYAHGEEIQMRLTSRKLNWLIPPLYKGAANVIANSLYTKTLLEEMGVRSDRIHVIRPGVDATAFQFDKALRRSIRQQYNLNEAPILLTIGRLQRRKGQDMVIRALPLVRNNYPDIRYLIVGNGEELEFLRQIAKEEGVQDSVIFTGQISDEERRAFYAACDIFVMPNRQVGADIEGFGIVFLEAGAAGKPVIGGRSGGTGEAIQEGITGVRVDGENREEIAAAIIDLLRDPKKMMCMGERGKQWVETEFTWRSVVERTRSVCSRMYR